MLSILKKTLKNNQEMKILIRAYANLYAIILSLAPCVVIGQIVTLKNSPNVQIEYAHQAFAFRQDVDEYLSTYAIHGTHEDKIKLPMPNGELVDLSLEYAPIMAHGLAERYPEIKSFKVFGEDGLYGRIGYTTHGFHGMVFTPNGTVYMDKIQEGVYHSYYRKEYMDSRSGLKSKRCGVSDEKVETPSETELSAANRSSRSGEQLRTYELALACTGEYAQFHGGTVVGALGAMVTTMNRVNGVYERDLAITMELIDDTDDLIFLDGNTDPYSNGSESTMLDENQNTVQSVIGNGNYDIGHVFGTGGGGIASLGSVCSNQNKARGVTSSNAPTGDPFDIDYVAHEMGHQFGGNHTQNNSCNRVSSAAYEPGSASTILGYAGICAPNLQNNSDDYFHTHSLDEIFDFAYTGFGNSCASTSNTGNSAPVVTAPDGGFFIPIETPFQLEGEATDVDNDELTYCWEQMDLGPSGNPNSPISNAPIFRSWSPTEDNFRVFPRMLNVIIGSTVVGETYPTYDRDLNFRLTVRDNNAAGGGTDYDEISFKATEDAGPFIVTSPVQGEEVEAGSGYTVEWDVANTDIAPVNCSQVRIDLCRYVTETQNLEVLQVLSESTENDGDETITIDLDNTGAGRYIRVSAVDNVFFNVNDGAFRVIEPSPLAQEDITLELTPSFGFNYVQLTWNDDFNNEATWTVERSLNGNSLFAQLTTLPANTTSFNDSTADVFDGHYVYRVFASNAVGNSDFSNEAEHNLLGFSSDFGSDDAYNVFPNPAKNRVFYTANTTIEEVAIIAQDGQIAQVSDARNTTDGVVDLTPLPAGVYTLRLTGRDAQFHHRLVIAK
ncbi:MAG: hypothetical protein Salg2KO_09900 [Salibacteraceae bacterium]